ncbi:c-type cytochrome [Vibrio sp. 99-70-13A1]|uniref:c-type cytochrome n=1 Tax=Vibrio sp. 99-70-13A1 TaxID=2607601 RepID=UPI0014932C24|nr:c-type cytochrome [Vibrio sp. 99-70-13A1]NOH97403.1 c-type cytochrome [Vibrio sp. 99-70-13A1]
MLKPLIILSSILSIQTFACTNIELGEALYIAPGKGGCATCHGETGNEPVMPMYPKISGQNEMYLFNQMKDYKNKKRKNGLFVPMEIAMEHYTEAEISVMAQFLAAQGSGELKK